MTDTLVEINFRNTSSHFTLNLRPVSNNIAATSMPHGLPAVGTYGLHGNVVMNTNAAPHALLIPIRHMFISWSHLDVQENRVHGRQITALLGVARTDFQYHIICSFVNRVEQATLLFRDSETRSTFRGNLYVETGALEFGQMLGFSGDVLENPEILYDRRQRVSPVLRVSSNVNADNSQIFKIDCVLLPDIL